MTSSVHQVNLSLDFKQVLELVQQLGAEERQKLIYFLLGRQPEQHDITLTHFASEPSLAKDWLNEAEEEAWQNL